MTMQGILARTERVLVVNNYIKVFHHFAKASIRFLTQVSHQAADLKGLK
jgi:hypothetical protein